jgi:hypothetical protein
MMLTTPTNHGPHRNADRTRRGRRRCYCRWEDQCHKGGVVAAAWVRQRGREAHRSRTACARCERECRNVLLTCCLVEGVPYEFDDQHPTLHGDRRALAVAFGQTAIVVGLGGRTLLAAEQLWEPTAGWCRVRVDHTHALVERARTRSGSETPVEFPCKYYDVVQILRCCCTLETGIRALAKREGLQDERS